MITKVLYVLAQDGTFDAMLLPEERLDVFSVTQKSSSRHAGRIAAKIAIIDHYRKEQISLDFDDIKISNDSSGAPVFCFVDRARQKFPLPTLSISHAGNYGVATIADSYEGKVGVDIEYTSRLTEDFGNKFLSENERRWVSEGGCEQEFYLRRTFLWCVKESYLKALGVGLRKDPRSVIVQNPVEGIGDMVILDSGKETPCSIFWYVAECNYLIVGLKI